MTPHEFIQASNTLFNLGFTERGGYTDKGVSRLVRVVHSVRGYLNGQNTRVNFVNLYHEYYIIDLNNVGKFVPECPDLEGLLAIWCRGYAFITCCDDPRQAYLDTPLTPNLKALARQFGLGLRGGSKYQVIYRTCRGGQAPLQCLQDFIGRLTEYLASMCREEQLC